VADGPAAVTQGPAATPEAPDTPGDALTPPETETETPEIEPSPQAEPPTDANTAQGAVPVPLTEGLSGDAHAATGDYIESAPSAVSQEIGVPLEEAGVEQTIAGADAEAPEKAVCAEVEQAALKGPPVATEVVAADECVESGEQVLAADAVVAAEQVTVELPLSEVQPCEEEGAVKDAGAVDSAGALNGGEVAVGEAGAQAGESAIAATGGRAAAVPAVGVGNSPSKRGIGKHRLPDPEAAPPEPMPACGCRCTIM